MPDSGRVGSGVAWVDGFDDIYLAICHEENLEVIRLLFDCDLTVI